MLYSLFQYLQASDFPGARLMSYITFRSGAAFVLALLIAIFIGRKIIDRLRRMQIGEEVRHLGVEGESKKRGTPTMGGIIIIISIMVPCLLVGNLGNVYMLLMLVATLWLGTIGFLDDYKKIQRHNKDGIKGKYKIIGQVGIGVLVAATMYLNPNMGIVRNTEVVNTKTNEIEEVIYESPVTHAPETTIPFVKNNNFSYSEVFGFLGDYAQPAGWILFFVVTLFLVTATSNGANLTDGLDGLATGVSATIGVALAVMAYFGSNIVYSAYLNIMYVPGTEELVVYGAAFIGALIGFLWYNAAPASVFMGDTGSLMLGGIIAVFAILIRKELLLPVLCGIFYAEDLSVVIQTAYFRLTGGKRVFKMAPLHHHFQKNRGEVQALIQRPYEKVAETKLVTRFWIIAIILAVITIVTLKIR